MFPLILIITDCFIGCLNAIIARVSCSAFENSAFPVASLFIICEYSWRTSIFHIPFFSIISSAKSFFSYLSLSFSIKSLIIIGFKSDREINSDILRNLPDIKKTASRIFKSSLSFKLSISSIVLKLEIDGFAKIFDFCLASSISSKVLLETIIDKITWSLKVLSIII